MLCQRIMLLSSAGSLPCMLGSEARRYVGYTSERFEPGLKEKTGKWGYNGMLLEQVCLRPRARGTCQTKFASPRTCSPSLFAYSGMIAGRGGNARLMGEVSQYVEFYCVFCTSCPWYSRLLHLFFSNPSSPVVPRTRVVQRAFISSCDVSVTFTLTSAPLGHTSRFQAIRTCRHSACKLSSNASRTISPSAQGIGHDVRYSMSRLSHRSEMRYSMFNTRTAPECSPTRPTANIVMHGPHAHAYDVAVRTLRLTQVHSPSSRCECTSSSLRLRSDGLATPRS